VEQEVLLVFKEFSKSLMITTMEHWKSKNSGKVSVILNSTLVKKNVADFSISLMKTMMVLSTSMNSLELSKVK